MDLTSDLSRRRPTLVKPEFGKTCGTKHHREASDLDFAEQDLLSYKQAENGGGKMHQTMQFLKIPKVNSEVSNGLSQYDVASGSKFQNLVCHIQKLFTTDLSHSFVLPASSTIQQRKRRSRQCIANKNATFAGLLVDHVPELYREPFLRTGYRLPGCSISDCLRSVLQLNNETFNFWTHFLPSVWFAACFANHWLTYPPSFHHYMIPFYLYLSTIVGYQIVSSMAHCLNAMSETARHVCFGFDYFACSLYAFGCAVAGVYAFIPAEQWFPYNAHHFSGGIGGGAGNDTSPPDSINTPVMSGFGFDTMMELLDGSAVGGAKVRWLTYREYIYLAVPCSVCSTAIACGTRLLSDKDKQLRSIGRAIGFAVPYWYAHAPILMRLARYPGTLPGDYYHMIQFVSTVFGVFFFCSRIPERLVPYSGRFDVFGHSHMLFHIASVCTTGAQMVAVRLDMFYQWKHNQLAVDAIQQSVEPILWAFGASYVAGLSVLFGFALLVCKSNDKHALLKRRLSSIEFNDVDFVDDGERNCCDTDETRHADNFVDGMMARVDDCCF